MNFIIYLKEVTDSFLMFFFRYPDSPVTGYFFGVAVIAFMSLIIGELSRAFAFRSNRDTINNTMHDIGHYQNLSVEALKVQNKTVFKACNGIANNEYGKAFFSMVTLSAASLWPVFIALGWMQLRFSEVTFSVPLLSDRIHFSVGYSATFITSYIVVRIVYSIFRSRVILPLRIRHITRNSTEV